MAKTLREEYTDIVNELRKDTNDLNAAKSILIDTLQDRVFDTVIKTDGAGAAPLIKIVYSIFTVNTIHDFVERLIVYHESEADIIRQARYRKKLKIKNQYLPDFIRIVLHETR